MNGVLLTYLEEICVSLLWYDGLSRSRDDAHRTDCLG